MPDHDAITAGLLAEELAKYGAVRMPWIAIPGAHPYSIAWRMGFGEDHICVVGASATGADRAQLEAAVRRGGPVPADWAWWAATFIGAIAFEDEPPFDEVKSLLGAHGIEVVGCPDEGMP